MHQLKSLFFVAQKPLCFASNTMSAGSSNTGGASDVRVDVSPQQTLAEDASFCVKVPGRGAVMFKVVETSDGQLMMASKNEVDTG